MRKQTTKINAVTTVKSILYQNSVNCPRWLKFSSRKLLNHKGIEKARYGSAGTTTTTPTKQAATKSWSKKRTKIPTFTKRSNKKFRAVDTLLWTANMDLAPQTGFEPDQCSIKCEHGFDWIYTSCDHAGIFCLYLEYSRDHPVPSN